MGVNHGGHWTATTKKKVAENTRNSARFSLLRQNGCFCVSQSCFSPRPEIQSCLTSFWLDSNEWKLKGGKQGSFIEAVARGERERERGDKQACQNGRQKRRGSVARSPLIIVASAFSVRPAASGN